MLFAILSNTLFWVVSIFNSSFLRKNSIRLHTDTLIDAKQNYFSYSCTKNSVKILLNFIFIFLMYLSIYLNWTYIYRIISAVLGLTAIVSGISFIYSCTPRKLNQEIITNESSQGFPDPYGYKNFLFSKFLLSASRFAVYYLFTNFIAL